ASQSWKWYLPMWLAVSTTWSTTMPPLGGDAMCHTTVRAVGSLTSWTSKMLRGSVIDSVVSRLSTDDWDESASSLHRTRTSTCSPGSSCALVSTSARLSTRSTSAAAAENSSQMLVLR